ncbi:hypothetical protein M0R45_019492 [Rubus argutus]|uniref:Uncharacterized protein n=1 Tax=Rubus argutus TaxID=59490 RepID=A0AAW1X7Z8_RUBAR
MKERRNQPRLCLHRELFCSIQEQHHHHLTEQSSIEPKPAPINLQIRSPCSMFSPHSSQQQVPLPISIHISAENEGRKKQARAEMGR